MTDFDPAATGPEAVAVAVIARRQPSANRWVNYTWQIIGVVTGAATAAGSADGALVRSGPDADEYMWNGLSVRLYQDECESYYHSLLAPKPALYVVTRTDQQGCPVPFLVTASYDLAHAYTEGDADAHPVPMPSELYGWIERFVLTHFVPQPRHKRERANWKNTDDDRD